MHYQAKVWEDAVAFHGHSCPGLAIGMAVCLVALRELGLASPRHTEGESLPSKAGYTIQELQSPDEEMICITETDACSVDAIQWIFSCTAGKGNLFFKLRGKHAYTFMHRPTQRAVRIVWDMDAEKKGFSEREPLIAHLLSGNANCYTVENIEFNPPEKAHIAKSLPCSSCKEMTMDSMMRMRGGEIFCLDCFKDPSRIL